MIVNVEMSKVVTEDATAAEIQQLNTNIENLFGVTSDSANVKVAYEASGTLDVRPPVSEDDLQKIEEQCNFSFKIISLLIRTSNW